MRTLQWAALVAALWILNATTASAAFVISVSGDASFIAPPPADVSPGAFQADAFAIWEESSGTIASDLVLDYDGTPGEYKGNDDYSGLGTTLAAGTKYNSAMIHLDPESTGLGSAQATVTFSGPIIGIALFGGTVDASDVYGAPGTIYPTGLVPDVGLDTRGIDYRGNDKFTVSLDGKTLELHFTGNGKGFDQFRVFTAQVPEPASLAVWMLISTGIGSGQWLRLRRVRGQS